ncbi:unnamed protein product [Triticum turgidum subsp. durum]|uniref:F-box associated domain-containing protein n=1 Tax=Triticum turgidum subsp. durum TaxID=4567 RepID=A0A9R0QJP2_TRITD|nr:unnamed protein product [Triticum turgidum subsp. durum]
MVNKTTKFKKGKGKKNFKKDGKGVAVPETAAFTLNRAPSKSVEMTPYELWFGKKPKLSFLKVWGCDAYVKKLQPEKLEPKSKKCVFIGHPKETIGYTFYLRSEGKFFVAKNGSFLEKEFLSKEISGRKVELDEVLPLEPCWTKSSMLDALYDPDADPDIASDSEAEADAVEDVAKYVVCNPATEEWTVLPAIEDLRPRNVIRLGFDPAAPSRFAVFVLLQDVDDHDAGVQIFSSETGTWTFRQSDWGEGNVTVDYYNGSPSTFFGGTLHLTTRDSSVITVDTEGKTWHKIRMPLSVEDTSDIGFIGHSQERLYALHMNYSDDECQLTVWVLEDYATGQWTLKHTADMSETAGDDEVCTFVAVDSEGNLIFQINGRDEQLVSYDMEKRKFHVIFSFESYFTLRCDPYIPTYKEWLPKAAP